MGREERKNAYMDKKEEMSGTEGGRSQRAVREAERE